MIHDRNRSNEFEELKKTGCDWQADEREATYQELRETVKNLRQNETRLEALLSLSQMTGVSEKEIRGFALESVVAMTKSKGG